MTSTNNILGNVPDGLLKITGGGTRPSSFTTRELRREAVRNACKAAKGINITDRKLRGGF
jgi:hypothetical protein